MLMLDVDIPEKKQWLFDYCSFMWIRDLIFFNVATLQFNTLHMLCKLFVLYSYAFIYHLVFWIEFLAN